jgi:hypothetical protein
MQSLSPAVFATFAALAALRAGPVEHAIVAAMRLSENPNYSWVATIVDDARTYDIVGQANAAGYTRVRMPLINSLRRRLGRSATDTEIDFIFRGNTSCVIKSEQGWLTPHELPSPPEADAQADRVVSPTGQSGIAGSRSISGGLMKGVLIRQPVPAPGDAGDRPRAYSNLQLGLSRPHEELGVLVSSHTDFRVEGDVASGTLTELGAALLLVRDGQTEVAPLRAAGTFKLWLRDGHVVRYHVRLSGVLQVTTPAGRQEVAVTQTADTILKEFGTTRVDVPDEARHKLGP